MNSSKPHDKRDGWYQITPIDAAKLLDEQPQNRPLTESKAVRFSRTIAAGKWRPNGETIILDEDGKLLDGQGRCRAVVIAGKPIETYVVFGAERKYFPTIDTGQIRTGADTLALAGHRNYAIASAMCRTAINASKGFPRSGPEASVTNEQISDYARKHAHRIRATLELLGANVGRSPLPPSILAYVVMEAMTINKLKAGIFANGVMTGEGLNAGSPMLLLRNRMIALKGETHKLLSYEKLALTIRAWNYFLADRTIGVLKWSPSKEAFPTMDDSTKEN